MKENNNGNKMLIGIIVAIIIVAMGIFIYYQPRKEIQSDVDEAITSFKTETTEYCLKSGCTNKRASGSNYCYTHNTNSSNSSGVSNKRCSATPCPNNAVTDSEYCSIHKKGKTKKCAKCGKAIWDDETLCDNCLYGSVINSMKK